MPGILQCLCVLVLPTWPCHAGRHSGLSCRYVCSTCEVLLGYEEAARCPDQTLLSGRGVPGGDFVGR